MTMNTIFAMEPVSFVVEFRRGLPPTPQVLTSKHCDTLGENALASQLDLCRNHVVHVDPCQNNLPGDRLAIRPTVFKWGGVSDVQCTHIPMAMIHSSLSPA